MILTRHVPKSRRWAELSVSPLRLDAVSLGNGVPHYLDLRFGVVGQDQYRMRFDARDMTKLREWLRPAIGEE